MYCFSLRTRLCMVMRYFASQCTEIRWSEKLNRKTVCSVTEGKLV